MAHSIPNTIDQVNTQAQLNSNVLQNDLSQTAQDLISHFWYTLLNKNSICGYFKQPEIAKQLGKTERTVYSALQELKLGGKIKYDNKGRNGILVTVLEKGWKLTKTIKTAFLAYFRDKGLIPYIDTHNTYKSVNDKSKPKDLIQRMCEKAGLNEGQIRAIREQIKKIGKIINLGGLINSFIMKVKEGGMQAIRSAQEMINRETLIKKLEKEAETTARTELEKIGIVEKMYPINATMEEFDAFNQFWSLFSTKRASILRELYISHDLATI